MAINLINTGMPRNSFRGGEVGARICKIIKLYLEQSSSHLKKDAPKFIPEWEGWSL